jgi:nucleoside-diphosphate-sugar epimerase
MKIFMIGGTGLLGAEAARVLIERGHEVSSVALPPIPEGCSLPSEMKLSLGNYLEMSDDEIRNCLKGCNGFIFAAGVDERVEGPAPIYDLYNKYNIEPVKRLLGLCRECGVRHAVILGSYFAHFNHEWPHLKLYEMHPYIRSRVDQANAALAFANGNMDVAVLELPYIFGTQPGRKPVWVFLAEQILAMKGATLYPKGGTTMVTVRQVGQCIAGALEKNRGGRNYPIGWYNLKWTEMLKIFHKYMGQPDKRIVTIPTFLYRMGMKPMIRKYEEAGHQPGLDLIGLVKIMTSEAFIDKKTAEELGATEDDIDAAIGQSVKLCMDIIEGRQQVIGMKGE